MKILSTYYVCVLPLSEQEKYVPIRADSSLLRQDPTVLISNSNGITRNGADIELWVEKFICEQVTVGTHAVPFSSVQMMNYAGGNAWGGVSEAPVLPSQVYGRWRQAEWLED